MTSITSLGAAGHMPALADQLLEVAGAAKRAATFADGEYIPQMTREFEVVKSLKDAGRAAAALEQLAPRIAVLDGGEDGMRLAHAALQELASGRMVLRDGVAVEDDVLRGGTLVADAIATGQAGQLFRDAEAKVRGIADIARIESMSPDDVLRGLLG